MALRHGLIGPFVAAALILLGGGRGALANGFFIPQQSAASIGRAFAGDSALATDASTTFFNPAGMVRLERAEIVAGASLLRPTVDFDNRGSTASTPGTLGGDAPYAGGSGGDPGSLAAAPSLFAAAPLTPRTWLGLAVSAPFGLSLDYDDRWFGRYDSIETKLLTLDAAPVVAFHLIPDVLAIGGGLNLRYVDARLTSAIPDTLAPGGPSTETDGHSRLTADAWDLGFNLGAHLQLGNTRFGLHYRSGFRHQLDGSLRISDLGGALASANGRFDTTIDFDTPAVLSFGVVHAIPSINLRLLGEVRHFNWSQFDEVRIRFADDQQDDLVLRQSFRDSYTIALGVEYDALQELGHDQRPRAKLTLRAGAQYDRTPTVDRFRNTSLPDADRLWLGVGATYRMTEQASLDAAANYGFFRDADLDLDRTLFAGTPAEGTVNIRGRAEPAFGTISAAVRWRF
jgi:long-chain fatty acid transport protein